MKKKKTLKIHKDLEYDIEDCRIQLEELSGQYWLLKAEVKMLREMYDEIEDDDAPEDWQPK